MAVSLHAATYTVNTTADTGPGSLRQGILDAQSGTCASPCTIVFNIPGPVPPAGWFTIKPASALPDINVSNVTIDGTTQTAFSGNTNTAGPEVEISGSLIAAAGVHGLAIRPSKATPIANIEVRGLAINKFTGSGIWIAGFFNGTYPSQNATIRGNYLGISPAGASGAGNSGDGLTINDRYNNVTVGGTAAADRNVIGGNTTYGVFAHGGGHSILGNFVGTDSTGTAAIPNRYGMHISPTDIPPPVIGGTAAGSRNVISGNSEYGILTFAGNSTYGNLSILGNIIGATASGSSALPNGYDGIYVLGETSGTVTIGGTAAGASNTIAFNGMAGIRIGGLSRPVIRANSIHSNGGRGVDSYYTNTPRGGAYYATYDSSTDVTTIGIRELIGPAAGSPITDDVYSSNAADPTGYGEGQTYIGTISGTPDANNVLTGKVTVAGNLTGKWITTRYARFGFTQALQVGTSVGSADLAVTLGHAPEPAPGSSSFTETITVTNNGASTGDNVRLQADLDPGYNVTATGPSWACTVSTADQSYKRVDCTRASLASGASSSVTLQVTTGNETRDTVSAAVASDTPDPVLSNNTAADRTTVLQVIDAYVSITDSPDPVEAGTPLTYAIEPAQYNDFGINATNPRLVILLPAGVTLQQITTTGWNCTPSGNTVTCTMASMPRYAPDVTVRVTAPTALGPITATATLTMDNPESDPNNNTSSATTTVIAATSRADLSITKTPNAATVAAGGPVRYTLAAANGGPDAATAVRVTDTLPSGSAYVAASGSGWTCAIDSGTVTCQTSSLASGAGSTITLDVTAPSQPGPFTNTASISSTTSDPNLANNTASANVSVQSVNADVSVTKSGPPAAMAGGSIIYTVHVANAGPDAANNVLVNDATPAGLTFVANSGDCATPYPCALGTLASGASRDIMSTYSIGSDYASASVINTALASSSTTDPSSSNNSGSTSAAVSACPAAPANLRPSDTSAATSGVLTWSPTSDAVYHVFLGKGAGGCASEVAFTSQTRYAYSGLDPNTVYTWRVVAGRTGCPSMASTCATFTTCAVAPPTLLSPSDGTGVRGTVSLSWSPVPGATAYRVFVWPEAGTMPADPTVVTTDTTAAITLPTGAYRWLVAAATDACGTAQSQMWSFAVSSSTRRRGVGH